jgi:hypothetical protein
MAEATVPVSGEGSGGQQSTAAQSVDLISQLVTSARQANEKAAADMRAATIPISGGHQQPSAIVQPGAGHVNRQYQLDNRPVVGKHNANMQGLANLTKSVANVVGDVQQAHDQKKTQQLSVNIEHLMGAINSQDQAKQILAQDPNNAAAKSQLEQANKIADEVLSDDKNRKAISKAFNINFTDPSKNNTPEHAALKQATESYAKQFADKLPTTMAPNQQAIAQAQASQAEAKATNAIVEKLAPAIVAAQSRENVADTAAKQRAQTAIDKSKADYDRAVKTAQIRADAAVKGAGIHAGAIVKAASIHAQSLLDVAQKKIDALSGVDGKSPKAQQEAQKALDSITKTLTGYQQNINLLEQNREKANPQQVEKYNEQIQFYEAQGQVLQLKQADLANKLSQAGMTPVTGGSNGSNGSVKSAEPTYIADGDDDPDDYDSE